MKPRKPASAAEPFLTPALGAGVKVPTEMSKLRPVGRDAEELRRVRSLAACITEHQKQPRGELMIGRVRAATFAVGLGVSALLATSRS